MELKELSRRISRYRANVENLQLEKNRLLNEIDALDQEALKIKLEGNSLFHSLLSELYKDSDNNKSIEHLKKKL